MMVMFRKIIYVFLGFFATVFALNVETGFNDGIMNVTLYEVEGLAQGEWVYRMSRSWKYAYIMCNKRSCNT